MYLQDVYNKIKIYKRIIFDFVLNIVASAIPVAVVQLFVLPFISRQFTSDNYGLILTIISLMSVIPASIGNVLNNIRLLYENEYQEKELHGDFNLIITFAIFINAILMTIASIYYYETVRIIDILFIIIISIIWLLNEYHIVAFRLKLNYKAILMNNIIYSVGFILGLGLFCLTNNWLIIYFCGTVLSLIFIFSKSNLWKEPYIKTSLFRKIINQCSFLLIANMLLRITNYADRLLLYPILGGTLVSIYYTSIIFGKISALIIMPITSVTLSYLSRARKRNDDIFKYSLILGVCFCVLGYFVCLVLSRPVLTFLYPQFVDEAIKYVHLTILSAMLNVINSIIRPFILKFCDMKWQIGINVIKLLLFVGISLVLLNLNGLMGFCIGVVITDLIILILNLSIYMKSKNELSSRNYMK